jgi:hypothetical protein
MTDPKPTHCTEVSKDGLTCVGVEGHKGRCFTITPLPVAYRVRSWKPGEKAVDNLTMWAPGEDGPR